jgi:N-hydroxyarylamine O-acetyltransferase
MSLPDNLFEKYLKLLDIEKSLPTYEFLCKITKAHLTKIPFENISKLIYKKQGLTNIPDLPTFLEGIEKFNFGGTCYTNNYYLYCLLEYLGFEIKLCGADMKNPDVHMISIVKIDVQEFIVDVGYAAPFYEPLPRNLNEDFTITNGNEKYIIKPVDKIGRTRVEQHSDDKLQHWYTAKPESRKIEDFRKVIEDSYSDDAVFMNAVRITRFTETDSIVLKNLYLTKTEKNQTSTIKFQLQDLPFIIQENFGIPLNVVKEAVGHFQELKDIYN